MEKFIVTPKEDKYVIMTIQLKGYCKKHMTTFPRKLTVPETN